MLCFSFKSQDEFSIGTKAKNDTQSTTCDYTACNGLTVKVDIYDTVQTYGQCQIPAGIDRKVDDHFCFVNANSACDDKVIWLNYITLTFRYVQHWLIHILPKHLQLSMKLLSGYWINPM